jgi:hypothetical protein
MPADQTLTTSLLQNTVINILPKNLLPCNQPASFWTHHFMLDYRCLLSTSTACRMIIRYFISPRRDSWKIPASVSQWQSLHTVTISFESLEDLYTLKSMTQLPATLHYVEQAVPCWTWRRDRQAATYSKLVFPQQHVSPSLADGLFWHPLERNVCWWDLDSWLPHQGHHVTSGTTGANMSARCEWQGLPTTNFFTNDAFSSSAYIAPKKRIIKEL